VPRQKRTQVEDAIEPRVSDDSRTDSALHCGHDWQTAAGLIPPNAGMRRGMHRLLLTVSDSNRLPVRRRTWPTLNFFSSLSTRSSETREI
jgi:hypothetical protein